MTEATRVKDLKDYTLEEVNELVEYHYGNKAAAARSIDAQPKAFRDNLKRLEKDAEYDGMMSEDSDSYPEEEVVEDEEEPEPIEPIERPGELVRTVQLKGKKAPPKNLEKMVRFPEPVKLDEAQAMAVYERGLLEQEFGEVLKGFAAASYKETVGTLVEFAQKMGQSHSTVKEQARIYSRLTNLPEESQAALLQGVKDGVLGYTHFLRANPIRDDEDYVKLLERTASEMHSVRWVGESAQVWKSLNSGDADISKGEQPNSYNPDGEYATLNRSELVAELQARDERRRENDSPQDDVIEATASLVVPDEILDAVESSEGDRYQVEDDALVDAQTGELVLFLSGVVTPDTFSEFVRNANLGAA